MGGIGKSPRRYAADYIAAKSDEHKKRAVYGCPAEWRDLVRTHIRNIEERQKWTEMSSPKPSRH